MKKKVPLKKITKALMEAGMSPPYVYSDAPDRILLSLPAITNGLGQSLNASLSKVGLKHNFGGVIAHALRSIERLTTKDRLNARN
jgi:hypothetical protein